MKVSSEQVNYTQFSFQTKDGKPFEIPVEGTLGILSLGHHGLLAWRQKRNQVQTNQEDQDKST